MLVGWVALFLSAALWVTTGGVAVALVDMKNGNYSETWTDFGPPSSSATLRRTYNSRTLHDGLFGFGWCSDYESTLEVMSPNTVVVTECGGGSEVFYTLDHSGNATGDDDLVSEIMTHVRERQTGETKAFFDDLERDLRQSHVLRREFKRELGIVHIPSVDEAYTTADGAGSVVFDGRRFVRHDARRATETFDIRGRLTSIRELGGAELLIRYDGERLVRVFPREAPEADLQVSYDPANGKVNRITSGSGRVVAYKVSNGSLTTVAYPDGTTERFEYDALYNMTSWTARDGSIRRLEFDVERDWVISFQNAQGCLESYTYTTSHDDPRNHYFSEVIKRCEGRVTNTSRYEFIFQVVRDRRYLATAISTVNGDHARVDYDPAGRTTRREVGSDVGLYSYDPIGRLIEVRHTDRRESRQYDPRCDVPIRRRVMEAARQPLRPAGEEVTVYRLEPVTCRIVAAASSDGSSIDITYGSTPGTATVRYGDGRSVAIRYGSYLFQPSRISMDGIGEILPSYANDGTVSLDESVPPAVATALLPALAYFRALVPANNFY